MVLNEKMINRHLTAISKRYPGKTVSTRVLITLVVFSIGLITLPLTAYFVSIHILHRSTLIGALAALVTIHIILAAFIYRAFNEPTAEIEMKEE